MQTKLFYAGFEGPLGTYIKLMLHLSGRSGHTGLGRSLDQNLLFVFFVLFAKRQPQYFIDLFTK